MKKFLLLVFAFLIFPSFVFATDKVEINTASLEQLDEIIGIGPALAQRIIDARPFSSVDDLIRVKGIGEKTLQKIKDQGLAYVKNGAGETEVATTGPEGYPTTATEPTEAIKEQTKDTPLVVYPTGVVLNEILPSPEGPDEENEWIEIYNQNNFEIDLSGWKIEDAEGAKTTYIFDKNTKIAPNGFLVLKRPETKITLNNTTDGLNLFRPDGKIIDSLTYNNTPRSQSYNKAGSDWIWSASLTPGSLNTISKNKQNNIKDLSNYEKSGNSNKAEAGLAVSISDATNPIKNSVSNGASPWFLFFTALIITIISAAIVLFVKFKLQKNNTNLRKHQSTNSYFRRLE